VVVKERKMGVVSVFGGCAGLGKIDLQENLTKGAAEREACSQPDLTGRVLEGVVERCKLVADLR
jgi:hypothetical protein